MTPSTWAARAVAHVEARSAGGPLPSRARITLNFHPDRVVGGVPILQAMRASGRYRSQFETGTSNGGLTAFPGGDRWRWEHEIFGGAYDDAPVDERPKYGGLRLRPGGMGAAPRFGSAFFVLDPAVLERATFCYPDSALGATHVATARRFDLDPLPDIGPVDALDGYVEAHVHGPVDLAADVEAIVLDPCFAGTDVDRDATALGPGLRWHAGRVIDADELARHVDYRGPEPVALGCELAGDGLLDARLIGEAANSGRHDPQLVKQVWHLLARWGRANPDGP